MELKLNAGDKIQIPDNCNAVIKSGVVVIEENKPKFNKGDCLRLESSCAVSVFIECSGIDEKKFPCGYETIITFGEVYTNNYMGLGWGVAWKVTKITREELQAEFNKLGYEYDFNTHTAKRIEWRPKLGEAIWYLGHYFNNLIVESEEFDGVKGDINVFRTRELAESALELIKNAKHY